MMADSGWMVAAIMGVVAAVLWAMLARTRRQLRAAERVGRGWCDANAELVEHLTAELRLTKRLTRELEVMTGVAWVLKGRLEQYAGQGEQEAAQAVGTGGDTWSGCEVAGSTAVAVALAEGVGGVG